MIQQVDELLKGLPLVRVDIHRAKIVEALARLHADVTGLHFFVDDGRRRIALAVQCAGQIAARVIEDISPAPVDEFDQAHHGIAHTEADTDSFVDVFGRSYTFLHHPCRLVHGDRLNSRNDEAWSSRTFDWHLPYRFQQSLQSRSDVLGRVDTGTDLDQRN